MAKKVALEPGRKSMQVEVREISPVIREVQVELGPEAVAAELEKIYRDLRQRTEVPGFRPGRVPRDVLEHRFGVRVRERAADGLVSATLAQALREAAVVPVAEPVVQKEPVSPGVSFRYTARCEVTPVLDPRDYFDLELEAQVPQVTDEEVDREIERLREERADLRPVEGRDRVQPGDFVVLDYDATIDGKPFQGGTARQRIVHVGSGHSIPGFEEGLLESTRGEPKTFALVLPTDLEDKKIAGRRAVFRVTVTEIKEKHLPALDDELAKELNLGETVSDLRSRVREDLTRRARERGEQELRERIVDLVLARNPCEVPPSLVEAELEAAVRETQLSWQILGLDPARMSVDDRRMRQDLRPRAERRSRQRLLLEAIAAKEKVEVSDDEVEDRIRAQAQATGQALVKLRQTYAKPGRKERLRAHIREERVLDLLLTRARINRVGAEESQPTSGS
jgi:trigger factor